MEKMKNIFGRNMAKLLVFLIGGILVLGLLSYGLLTLSKTVAGQGHKIEICTYYQDNSTKNLSSSAGTISVNGNLSDSVQGRVGSSVSLSATPNENYQFMGFYRDLEFTDVISRDSSCVYEISADDAKIFAQFLKVYPVTFTFQDANFNTHTITKKFPYGYTFGQEEIKELIEQEAGEAGLSVFENKLAKLNPSPETATDTTSTNMCFTVGSGTSFFNLTPAPLDDVGISGSGTSASPYLIANATDLATFRDTVNGTKYDAHAKLTADITLSGNWTPIGNSTYQYTGVFDGDSFEIANLSISTEVNGCYGLFGICNNATISNFILRGSIEYLGIDSDIYGTAGVCGNGTNININNCTTYVTITAMANGAGIMGLGTGSIFNCFNMANINSKSHYAGGIYGSTSSSLLTIKNCINYGNIVGDYDNYGGIGGLYGLVYNSANFGLIESKHSSWGRAGGIIGCYGIMYNCYNKGNIKSKSKYVGGIGGESANCYYCYNAGTVTCTASSSYAYDICHGTASNSSHFTHTAGTTTNTLSSSITVSGYSSTTVLLTALNNWVNKNNSDLSYSLWNTNVNINDGLPSLDSIGIRAIINYDANGGFRLSDLTQTYLSVSCVYKTPIILPMKNYIFYGWFTDKDEGAEITNNTLLPHKYFEQTLYARWASYKISGGGSGTEADPYIIKTEQDLIAYRDWINASPDNSGLCAKLNNDITLTKEWTPIGNRGVWEDALFTGVFDGCFYGIYGLSINATSSYQGLFGTCDGAIIKNLNIKGGNINSITSEAYSNIAGICGSGENETYFINCSSTCSVVATGEQVAGICGVSRGGIFVNCFNGGKIISSKDNSDCEIGGITSCVGAGSTYFYNCYNYGSVSSYGANLSIGGVVGENNVVSEHATIINCYNLNIVAGNVVYGSGNAASKLYDVVKGNASFHSFSQLIMPCDEGVTDNYVYNIATGEGTAMSETATLLEALNKFVELNPVMYGVKLSSWAIKDMFPKFTYMDIVTFNANGGSGGPTEQAVIDGQITISSDIPTKTGYTFVGWSTQQNATYTNFLAGSTYNISGSLKLYAVWRANTYTVLYNGNNSTSGSTANSVHTYGTNKALTSNGFSRTGYQFLGWSTSNSATSATYTNGQSVSNLTTNPYDAVILYAVWQGNSYTVKYNANGGSGSMSNSSHVYGTFSPLSACTFEKEGHFFVGWSKDSNAIYESYDDKEEVWNLSATNGATVTLYAIWLKKDITVTVDPNGGVYNGVETATVYNCSVGSDLVLGVPSRHGYEFTEFNTQGDGLGQTLNGTMVLNGDVTFYALWEPLNYYIKYYDGDLYLGQTEAWYNENLSLTRWETLLANNSLSGGKFTQYGWNFAGWTADTNGTTVQHNNGAPVLNLTEAGTTINLYAMHTQTLNLTYNGNGSTSGNVANQNSDILLNSASEKITDFVIKLASNSYAKTNYSFKNWAIGSTSGTQKSAGANITNVDLGLIYSSSFNKTIYAIWQGNSYTINYYNGTTKISTGNYVYGNSATLKTFSTIGTVNNLAYGWEFYGWATANNTFTRVFVDGANITNISIENGAEITQNMVINLYSIYSREITFVSGVNSTNKTTATQFWNPYSTNNSNLSSVLAEVPQTIETGNWIALGYRADLTAGTAIFALTTTTEIRPTANAFNTLYAVYSRTITIADLNTTTTATQYYNSVGTVSTVGQ